jgi:hypothetical protein
MLFALHMLSSPDVIPASAPVLQLYPSPRRSPLPLGSVYCSGLFLALTALSPHAPRVAHQVLGTEGGSEPSGDAMLSSLRGLVYADFMTPGADPRVYAEVRDPAAMQRVVTDYMADFNATSKKPMNLVLFQFALEHVARICRIITSPGGNALLVRQGRRGGLG